MIKNIFIKLNLVLGMLAFSAGIIIFSCAFTFGSRVPGGVTVDGIDVGGKSILKAAAEVRAQSEVQVRKKRLSVISDRAEYRFEYPEIAYKDNVYELLKYAKKGQCLTSRTEYYLCGANEIAAGICLSESRLKVEPYAKFSKLGEPFTFFEGEDGKIADKAKLLSDINASLNGDGSAVKLQFKTEKRQTGIDKVKREHILLARFTTYFDGTNLNRVSNIRLSASMLNGTVIEGGKTLSFNDIVGERVKERGFLPAKIIFDGEFVDGVGGGVCQVSTTLYNCALLAGMEIEEFHPHSLSVSYVAPSRDAMVSGREYDLKIKNTRESAVYIRAQTTSNGVTFSIYGAGDGATYSIESVVSGAVAAPEEITDDPAAARDGKDGVVSESYIKIRRGAYEKRVLLRKDRYAPVKKVVFQPPEQPTEQPAEQSAEQQKEKLAEEERGA